jgi:CRISPR/Cas system CSM-associated protein Csm5 (group 7 of RAMP superfamily)
MKDLNSYHLKLTALSPIHIGTGESYEPTNFVIDNGTLYEFDEVLFYKSLSDVDKKALNNKMSSWLQIIEFYKTKKEQAKEIAFFECQVSKEVQNKYDAKNPNQLQINRTFKNPNTHRAVIAGSGIKGMLDTVFGIYPPKSSNEERQKLIVSDALSLDGSVEIGYSYRKHRFKKQNGKGIPQMVEVIKPKSTFIMTLKTKLTFEQIQQSMKKYHDSRKNSLYNQDNQSFIARVGKYSGKEYMVDSNRNLTNTYGKPLATHSLYNSNLLKDEMFGWVKFELISKEIYQNSLEKVGKSKEEAKQKALQKQKEEEETKRKEEEQKRKETEKLAQMSPVEALIYELVSSHPNKNETKDIIIYNAIKSGKLDEYRCEALKILEQEMKVLKKWVENSKKKKQAKQHKRTLEVIAMLQECQ